MGWLTIPLPASPGFASERRAIPSGPPLVGRRQSLGGVTAKVNRLEQDRDAGGRHIDKADDPGRLPGRVDMAQGEAAGCLAHSLCGHQRRKS